MPIRSYRTIRFHIKGYTLVHGGTAQSDAKQMIRDMVDPPLVVEEVGIFEENENKSEDEGFH
jgi:hypothetical protein